jgi:lipoate synthase
MKLLKTIEKLIKESEEAYIKACETFTDENELNRLEKNYKDSLKLLRTYKSISKPKPNK